MDDYAALAQRISVAVSGVSGCLILSRDGMVLGAHPNEDESLAKPAWLTFISLGEPERGFVEYPDQVWAYVRRGPYAAFATAEAGTRPGVLVDQLEQLLLLAEEGRTRRDTLRVPDAPGAPSGKPRTSLHPQAERPPVEVAAAAPPAPEIVHADAAAAPPPDAAPASTTEPPKDRGAFKKKKDKRGDGSSEVPPPSEDEPAEAGPEPTPEPPVAEPDPAPATGGFAKEPRKLAGGAGTGFDEDAEVDRVLLAKEFSGLLQVDSDGDEGSS
jgi:hypothetical protein